MSKRTTSKKKPQPGAVGGQWGIPKEARMQVISRKEAVRRKEREKHVLLTKKNNKENKKFAKQEKKSRPDSRTGTRRFFKESGMDKGGKRQR